MEMLTGGHPNSLGRTIEVVELVLEDKQLLQELYDCYFSTDEVVRLRTSNALKRICKVHPDWLIPYIDGLIGKISQINQASTQWTLAQLFLALENLMTNEQRHKAKQIMMHNLAHSTDWIVLNQTMQTLAVWAKADKDLQEWLNPVLIQLTKDPHKSVATKAKRLLKT